MTIDEAIELLRFAYPKEITMPITEECISSIEEWLEELKDLRKWKEQEEKACDKWYNKAIDDFATELELSQCCGDWIEVTDCKLWEIAEQLKGE